MKPSTNKVKKVKAWVIISRGGVLIGGGEKKYGYTPLAVYSTKLGAKYWTTPTRPNDVIVPCTISFTLPKTNKK